MKLNRFLIIFICFISILFMSVGYSSFAEDLLIGGNAEIVGKWNIKITSVEVTYASDGLNVDTPTFTDTTFDFSLKLNKPGDKVIYTITIQNAGTIDAILQSLVFNEEANGSEAISYTVSKTPTDLNAGDTTTLELTITYNESTEELPEVLTKSLTGTITYAQK